MNRRLVGKRHHIQLISSSSSKPMPMRCLLRQPRLRLWSPASHLSVCCADQFQSVQLPETVEEVLNRGTATCAEFNPWGTLLAGRPRNLYHTVTQMAAGMPLVQPLKKHSPQAAVARQSMKSHAARAAGGALGEVIIWDFATKGIARASQPHDHAVTSLAWTRDGRHVISAADDSTVSSLSVLDNKQVGTLTASLCTFSVLQHPPGSSGGSNLDHPHFCPAPLSAAWHAEQLPDTTSEPSARV